MKTPNKTRLPWFLRLPWVSHQRKLMWAMRNLVKEIDRLVVNEETRTINRE